ncbi:MAG TPA: hypothetical protein VGK73_16095 [Polyangiaceae bacterium]
MMTATRTLLALEFVAAAVLWGLGACAWPLAGAVMAGALVVLMLSFDEVEAPNLCDPEPMSCRLFGCTHAGDPLYGRCDRCGGRP